MQATSHGPQKPQVYYKSVESTYFEDWLSEVCEKEKHQHWFFSSILGEV